MSSERTPKDVARQSSVFIGVLSSVAVIIVLSVSNSLNLWAISIIVGVVLEELSYFVIYNAIEKYIDHRIQILYKTISKVKGGGDLTINMDEDVVELANQDVMEWAEGQIEEINLLRETDSFRKDFIGNLAHELKTPLFNIQGFILSLLEGGIDDPEINRKFLSKAEKNIDRMTSLLEDLDSISKIESGAMNIEMETVDIVELSSEIAENLDRKAKDANVQFKIREEEEFNVLCDPNKIGQVLSNLLVNSINYGVENGKTVVRFYDMGDNILIEVADDGIGIDEEDLLRIYERFYRVDKSRSRHAGGSGLGLSIVKHIVEAHGGNLHVRSTLGTGTTFSFTLQKAPQGKT
ncbi:MAG: sensor histidine kinase [Flavobacteriales bacterium]|jgi:two-component system phosphate regulon sensor histidine kinase PhoR|tara:strand:- start:335 stop:1384 length:1050 start_codon:yes stop_codon:yes gene_type:complete